MREAASRGVSANGVEPRQVVETGIGGIRKRFFGGSAVADVDRCKCQKTRTGFGRLLILIEEDVWTMSSGGRACGRARVTMAAWKVPWAVSLVIPRAADLSRCHRARDAH